MPIGNGVGSLAQRVNFVPNPFVSIENRAAKMDLETVLLIPISPTMGSAKTGGDTFIVLGAISFWFDIPVCIQTIEWRAMSDYFHFLDVSQFPRHVNRRTRCHERKSSGAAGSISPWSFWCHSIEFTSGASQNRKQFIELRLSSRSWNRNCSRVAFIDRARCRR